MEENNQDRVADGIAKGKARHPGSGIIAFCTFERIDIEQQLREFEGQ